MADVCTISGLVANASGVNVGGACVEASAETPQSVQGSQQSDRTVRTATDMDGNFSIDLVRGAVVRFLITDPATKTVLYEQVKTVPLAATQDLATWP